MGHSFVPSASSMETSVYCLVPKVIANNLAFVLLFKAMIRLYSPRRHNHLCSDMGRHPNGTKLQGGGGGRTEPSDFIWADIPITANGAGTRV